MHCIYRETWFKYLVDTRLIVTITDILRLTFVELSILFAKLKMKYRQITEIPIT